MKNNVLRLRVDFENSPLFEVKKTVRDGDDLDALLDGVKEKLFGGKR